MCKRIACYRALAWNAWRLEPTRDPLGGWDTALGSSLKCGPTNHGSTMWYPQGGKLSWIILYLSLGVGGSLRETPEQSCSRIPDWKYGLDDTMVCPKHTKPRKCPLPGASQQRPPAPAPRPRPPGTASLTGTGQAHMETLGDGERAEGQAQALSLGFLGPVGQKLEAPCAEQYRSPGSRLPWA